jgi:hypothetical protein
MSLILLRALALLLFLPACGKYLDRFSRVEGTTIVSVQPAQSPGAAILNGGLVVYFVRQTPEGQNANTGQALGFTQEELSATKSLALPNGSYKIFGLGYLGANSLGGAARCALGNNGGNFVLSGGDQLISLNFSAAACGFGGASFFSSAEGATGNSGNFDELRFNFCDSLVSSGTCTPNASNTTNGIRFSLLAGRKTESSFIVDEASTINSACFAPVAGTVSGSPAIPIGAETFSLPVRITIYTDNSCNTVAASYVFDGGLAELLNPANGASFYSIIPASEPYSFVKIKFP